MAVEVDVEAVGTETVRALDDGPAALPAATATAPASAALDAGSVTTGTGALADASADTDTAPRL